MSIAASGAIAPGGISRQQVVGGEAGFASVLALARL